MNKKLKTIWTERDFDVMNWHDAVVHALSIDTREYDYELILDVDYILEWIKPVAPDNYYSFVIAPATIIFSGVWDIKTDLATRESVLEPIRIQDIQRENQRNITNSEIVTWDWTISLIQGTIRFNGSGYTLYLRRKPILTAGRQELLTDERGPLSFGREYIED